MTRHDRTPTPATPKRQRHTRRAAVGLAFGSLAAGAAIYASNMALAAPTLESYGARTHRLVKYAFLRGINVAGAEFGLASAKAPGRVGRQYYYPTRKFLEELASRGHRVIRLPFSWERVQAQIGGPLRSEGVEALRATIQAANDSGLMVIMDLHNYGRFAPVEGTEWLLNAHISPAQFGETWSLLVAAFKDELNIVGWGLMNEPHDLPANRWRYKARRRIYRTNQPHEWEASDGASVTRVSDGIRVAQALKKSDGNYGAVMRISRSQEWSDNPRPFKGNAIAWRIRAHSRTPGTVRVRPELYDSDGNRHIGTYAELRKGKVTTIFLRVPKGTAMRRFKSLAIQVEVDGSDGKTSTVVDILRVNSGDLSGGQSGWKVCSQAAVDAIRASGDGRPIYVGGDSFSNAAGWKSKNGAPWISDPRSQIVYEAHYYFAENSSGQYPRSYNDLEVDAKRRGYQDLSDRVSSELSGYVAWLRKYAVQGFVGEVGWPQNGQDADSYERIGNQIFRIFDGSGIGATYWAAGMHWNANYPLQPYDVRANGSLIPRQQAAVIEKFPSRRG